MRHWQVPAVGAAVVALTLTGLTGCGEHKPQPPMATTGPKQVVYDVPGMT